MRIASRIIEMLHEKMQQSQRIEFYIFNNILREGKQFNTQFSVHFQGFQSKVSDHFKYDRRKSGEKTVMKRSL